MSETYCFNCSRSHKKPMKLYETESDARRHHHRGWVYRCPVIRVGVVGWHCKSTVDLPPLRPDSGAAA